MSLAELRQVFTAQFQVEPTLYFAPGRVNLIGEHTDYNGGHVFPCAITLGTYGAAAKRSDRKICCYSLNRPETGVVSISLDAIENKASNDWANYPFGMIATLQKAGYILPQGLDLAFWGNLPNGAGLSSSASLEVLTAFICKDLFALPLELVEIAKLAQKAENEFVGMNCGIMDQFAVAMGQQDKALFLDCSTLQCEYLPVSLADCQIVITNTNNEHKLVGSEYNLRRQQCETALANLRQVRGDLQALGELDTAEYELLQNEIKDPVCRRRARHAVTENQRTIAAVAALRQNDLAGFGKLMRQSHESLRDDYEVTGKELDTLAELAWQQPGTVGSRMTGGGFGGCTVSIVHEAQIPAFKQALTEGYRAATGLEPSFYVAAISPGVHKL